MTTTLTPSRRPTRKQELLRTDWELTCSLCGRGGFAYLTEDEARSHRLQVCSQPHCNGRVFLTAMPTSVESNRPEPKPDTAKQIRLSRHGSLADWSAA